MLTASFISLVLPPSGRQQTPVVKKSLDPVFVAEGSTFEFPLYLSLAGMLGGRGLEVVVWDKVGAESRCRLMRRI